MQLSYSDYQEYYHDIFDGIYNDAQGYKSLEQCHEETEVELKKQNIKLKK